MALFGSKKNKKKTGPEGQPEAAKIPTNNKTDAKAKNKNVAVATKGQIAASASATSGSLISLSGLIQRPRITEKASMLAESNAYAFEVSADATKATVATAIRELYNVEPIKVAILKIPTKQVIVQNKKGLKRGGKKAYVYLQKGQTIELT
jgi:large subunit ribosomal protein L23